MLKKLLWMLTLTILGSGAMALAAETGLPAQTSNEQAVTVTVSPRALSGADGMMRFEVILESQTRALNEDMAQSSTLIADGKQYFPLFWEGEPPGGKLRAGSLRFKAITPRPTAIELQIRLTGEDLPRSFQWTLNNARHNY